ncbi:MAG: hypothetical protein ACI82Z_001548 [Cellvibrionaceae bacterium]|jgi:hypothetical protein
MNNKIYLLVLVIFIFGCATAPEIIIKPSKPGDSVALIYLSDSTPRHEHVGTTVFTNFTKKDVSKKSYEESISNGIEELIKSKSNFSVVRIKLEEIGIKENEKLYSAWTGKMLPKYKTSIERLSREKNFGYVVVINQSWHEAWANSSAHVEGFGL